MKSKLAGLLLALAIPTVSESHSQLFMKPQVRLVAAAEQGILEIRHVWRFEAISSTVLLNEFDQNATGSLEDGEREEIAKAVRGKTSPFTAETHLVQNGLNVRLTPPAGVRVDVIGAEMIISFSMKPIAPTRVAGRLAFWMDDKNNTILDFKNDSDLRTSGSAFEGCQIDVIRLSEREASSRNQAIATDMFFNDPNGQRQMSLTSTRLEIACPK